MRITIVYSVPIQDDYSEYGELIGEAVTIHGAFTDWDDAEHFRDDIWEPGYDFVVEEVDVR